MEKNNLITIILPTYNEAGNILSLIRDIKKILHKIRRECEIIIVDDNSPDQTGYLVKKTFPYDGNIKVIIRKNEKGLASAIYLGIKKARGNYLVVMDTDYNHDPKIIKGLISFLKRYELVIGSRYIKDGGMENKTRYWLSYFFNLYIRLLLHHGVHDNLSGFFAIRKEDIHLLPTGLIFFGFGDYFMRLIFYANRKKMKMIETPVYYKNRTWGESKSKFFPMLISYTDSALKLRFSQ